MNENHAQELIQVLRQLVEEIKTTNSKLEKIKESIHDLKCAVVDVQTSR